MIALHQLLQLLQLRSSPDDHQLDFRIAYIAKALDGNLNAFFLCNPTDKYNQAFILLNTVLSADFLHPGRIDIIRVKFLEIQPCRYDVDRSLHPVLQQRFLRFFTW